MIFPGRAPRAALDATAAAYYDAWKARYLEPGCQPGEYRVTAEFQNTELTVAEKRECRKSWTASPMASASRE